jgi:DNA-binding SARP family transcriptional activator
MLDVAMLGQFDVQLDEEPVDLTSRPLQLLLAYLMLNAGQTLPREKIAGVLWPESLESTARKNLRNYVWRLRKAIGEDYLSADRNTVTFDATAAYRLDVETLEEAAGADSTEALIEAVSAYRGELLPGHYDDWVQRERERLRAVFERRMQTLLDRLTAEARWSDLVTWSEHWLAFGQTPEPAYRSLMMGHAGLGDLAGTAKAYQRCEQALEEELRVAPSQETQALYRQLEAGGIRAIVGYQRTVSMAEEPKHSPLPLPVEESAPIFVTREQELSELSATLDSARSKGKGQVQFVIGGAGRGKTALVAEFARQMQKSDSSLLVISGHCHGHAGISDPYSPFREALSQLTGDVGAWSGGDLVTREAAQRLWEAMPLTVPSLVTLAPDLIDTLIPGADLLRRATTFAGLDAPWFRQLSARMETPYRDNLQQKRLFGQVARLLKAVAMERPLLFILEDLHWADDATTGLLFHLSRAIGDSRILLLGTYRPDEIAVGQDTDRHPLAHSIGELKRQHGDIWLDLGEVNDREGRAFIDAYLDTEQNRLDEDFRQALFEHTGGHALFVVELLRGMQERKDLIQDEDGAWTTQNGIDWQTLPARVEGVIEQRFGRLDAEMQSTLIVASVEGMTFTAEVVAQVRKQSARELVRRLSGEVDRQHRLVRAGPLATAGSQRLSHYHFRHHLFQQYLYQGLDETELVYLHEDVGRALEGVYGDEARQIAARLARHFEEAGLTAQAVGYLIVAARRAARLGANREVIAHCKRGLTLLHSFPENAQKTQHELALQVSLGHALMATRGYANAETGAAFTRARELCGRVVDTPQLLPILRGIWAFYLTRAEYRIARELAEEKLQSPQKQQVAGLDLNSHWMMGMTLFHLGEVALPH